MMDPQEAARRWAATWTTAWQARDVEPVVALYADDCVHRSTPFRPPYQGRQAVREYVAQAFADEQRIDNVRFGTLVVQGDRACVEYWAQFLDQDGTAMTLAGCAMARFDADGRISEARDYWHLNQLVLPKRHGLTPCIPSRRSPPLRSLAGMGVDGSGFGHRRGGSAWQDYSSRRRRLEGSGVTFDELLKPADDGELVS